MIKQVRYDTMYNYDVVGYSSSDILSCLVSVKASIFLLS